MTESNNKAGYTTWHKLHLLGRSGKKLGQTDGWTDRPTGGHTLLKSRLDATKNATKNATNKYQWVQQMRPHAHFQLLKT